jgi:hypothetical protein
MHVTLNGTGLGSTQQSTVMKNLSLDIALENPDGGNVSDLKGGGNSEIAVDYKGSKLGTLRVVGKRDFVYLNVENFTKIDGVNLPASNTN